LVSQNSLDQMKTITEGIGMGMAELLFDAEKAMGIKELLMVLFPV